MLYQRLAFTHKNGVIDEQGMQDQSFEITNTFGVRENPPQDIVDEVENNN